MILGQANQIFRPVPKRDEGIDAEIEFTDDRGRGTGRRLYLQLKAGDSYFRDARGRASRAFDIKEPRWVKYWQDQKYPVMLMVRTSNGVIRWMDVSAVLKQRTRDGETNIRSVEFRAEPFTVENLLKKRAELLLEALSTRPGWRRVAEVDGTPATAGRRPTARGCGVPSTPATQR